VSVLRAPLLVIKWLAVALAVLVWIAVVPIIDFFAGALSRVVEVFTGRSANAAGELEVEPTRTRETPETRTRETPETAPPRPGV
jgi:hypothetical protein